MTTPAYPYFVCPNGHGAAAFASARFCSTCGATLVPSAPPAQTPPPPQPSVPPNAWLRQQPYQYPTAQGQYPQSGWPVPQPEQPAAQQVVIGTAGATPVVCSACGSDGSRLDANLVVCPSCRWLRPLTPGYIVHPSAFQWGADGAAMAKLRSFAPLTAAARAVSDKVGRKWVETSFNAVRIGENQLADTYATAVRAARLLGMPSMPDVYVSGDKMWDAVTYGSDRSSFVLMGTSLINNYKDDDLLFLFAREMGHCRTGHALWKTVGMFLVGQQHQYKGGMSDGLLGALNPDNLIQGAVEVPLLGWARQAEITADRAGLLAVGSEEVARRVLLSWSLRSVPLFAQINVDAWLQQQQEDSDDQLTKFAEAVSSPTPFITRRLKLLGQFAGSPELAQMRSVISTFDRPAGQPASVAVGAPSPAPTPTIGTPGTYPGSFLATPPEAGREGVPDTSPQPSPWKGEGARTYPGSFLATPPEAGREGVPDTSPQPSPWKGEGARTYPGSFLATPPEAGREGVPETSPQPSPWKGEGAPAPPTDDAVRVTCPQCGTGMRFDRAAVAGKPEIKVRCPNTACGSIITLRQNTGTTVDGV